MPPIPFESQNEILPRTALITGASGGIGSAIAEKLSSVGIKIFLTGRNQQKLEERAHAYSAEGFLAGDLLEEDFLEKLIETAQNSLRSIDILINNAGQYYWSDLEGATTTKIDEILNLNLKAPYRLSQMVVSPMKEKKWGRIINIGSISGSVGEPNASLYSLSKAGLIGMTKALALELAEFGITVNTINPGWVKTDLTDKAIVETSLDENICLDMIPQKRWIEPAEIAHFVAVLCSAQSSVMTGQSINLCAGLSLG